MRYIRIFLLHAEHVLEYRSRVFVWFLFSLISTAVFLLFWKARYASGNMLLADWTLGDITAYYLISMFSQSVFMSYIEEDIADFDIYRGEINKFILKPYAYYLAKFYVELPYRLLQGFYAIVVFTVLWLFFPALFSFNTAPVFVLLGLISGIIAFFVSHTFKMALGLIAFWTTDVWYLIEVFDMMRIFLSGVTVPLVFLPDFFRSVAFILPFGHMVYTPVVIFMGKLSFAESLFSIGVQILWLCFFIVAYKVIFNLGIKRFTGFMD